AAKTWYGMPAYAKDGKIVCFFQTAQKFNTRYATLGFNDAANLDDGALWPVAFALKALTTAEGAYFCCPCFASIFAHSSLSVTVRLKTSWPGCESGSTQK